MSFYTILLHLHSFVRWLVLFFILLALVRSTYDLVKKTDPNDRHFYSSRFAMIFVHVQILLGIILYIISPKVVFDAASMSDSLHRFYLVEHIGLMVIAAVLVSIGHVRSLKVEGRAKYKTRIIYFSISLILILAAIPWPFRGFGAGWI